MGSNQPVSFSPFSFFISMRAEACACEVATSGFFTIYKLLPVLSPLISWGHPCILTLRFPLWLWIVVVSPLAALSWYSHSISCHSLILWVQPGGQMRLVHHAHLSYSCVQLHVAKYVFMRAELPSCKLMFILVFFCTTVIFFWSNQNNSMSGLKQINQPRHWHFLLCCYYLNFSKETVGEFIKVRVFTLLIRTYN